MNKTIVKKRMPDDVEIEQGGRESHPPWQKKYSIKTLT
jgi:hypothetical protein